MKKWLGLSFGTLLCVLVLELLPWGVTVRWASPEPGIRPTSHYPYFHLLPYAYGNFGPFLTAVLTALLLVLSVVILCLKRPRFGWLNVLLVFTIAAILTSLMPLVMLSGFTVIGGFISALLLVSLILQLIARQPSSLEKETNLE